MGRFVRELRAANRLIDDQERAVGRLRQAYDDLGRTRVGAPTAPGGEAAGGVGAPGDINVRFTVDQSSVGTGIPGESVPLGSPGALGSARISTAGARAGKSGGGAGDGRGRIGSSGGNQDTRDALAAILANAGITAPPAKDRWDPVGTGDGARGPQIIQHVLQRGVSSPRDYLLWCAGWLAYSIVATTRSASSHGTGPGPQLGGYLSHDQVLAAGRDNIVGNEFHDPLRRDAAARRGDNIIGNEGRFFGQAIQASGDATVKAIKSLENTVAKALAGDGGAGLRAEGGL